MDEYAQLRNVDPNLADRYLVALQKAIEGRGEGLSFEEIQAIIDEVNEQVRRERLCECCVLYICQNDLWDNCLCFAPVCCNPVCACVRACMHACV